MNTTSFLELEYQTLRKEVEDANTRAFQLIIGGAAIIPTIQSIASSYKLEIITLTLPLFVLTIIMLYLAQDMAIARCGRYIREKIEPAIGEGIGWETWLNQTNRKDKYRPRAYDNFVFYGFCLLAGLYYICSVLMATRVAESYLSITGIYILIIGYVVLGIVIIFLIYSSGRALVGPKAKDSPR